MKTIKEKGLFCPFCGSERVVLRKNASKDFQVMCNACKSHGGWFTKPQAIISWFTMAVNYWKSKGYLTLPEKEK